MLLPGHRTPSIFRRYNITSDEDLRSAVRKLASADATAARECAAVKVEAREAYTLPT